MVGFGVNVNMRVQKFPDGTDGVSCASLSGHRHDRAELFAVLLFQLEKMHRSFCAGGFAKIAPHYNSRLVLLDREVEFRSGGRRRRGEVIGVRHDGALAVRSEGKILALYDEEITLL